VLHFFSGAKPEYHRAGDRLELLNVDGIERLADYVAETATFLAASEEPLTFRPAGIERVAPAAGGKARRVSFGSIPDFARESGGVLLSGVMPGTPAEAAGLRAGDLLVEMDGRAIDTIQDFQAALADRSPGDRVVVRYVRGGETITVEVTLAERR
jgi:S1-C subfamily serine protease